MARDSASVVIIGAGIVGSSVAYHLAARGCTDVVILEKAATEVTGSTARSAAGVRHQFANEVNIRLSLYSIERLKRFHEEVGGDSGLKQIGYLLLVSEPARWEQYRKGVALQNSLGVASRAISPAEVVALMPCTEYRRSAGRDLLCRRRALRSAWRRHRLSRCRTTWWRGTAARHARPSEFARRGRVHSRSTRQQAPSRAKR